MLGPVRAMALGISRVGMTGFAKFEVPAFAGTTTSEVPAGAGTTKRDERGSRLRGDDERGRARFPPSRERRGFPKANVG